MGTSTIDATLQGAPKDAMREHRGASPQGMATGG